MQSDLERLSDEYEDAEATFIAALRNHEDRATQAAAARTLADVSFRFNGEAYRRFHLGVDDAWMPLDFLTERTEVLSELWADLASAYGA